ncbi:MAG: M61 family peptidase, partial [Flavisolibacter sp.]|nr:M61 family peptidase [Flavisolibacter sp.]
MKQFSFTLSALVIIHLSFAQSIRYEFAAPNSAHHEAEISLAVDKLPSAPVYFRMSRSSPGRYATHEFGKNVYNVKAFDATGKPLIIEKEDADVYRINKHNGFAKVSYTLFANYPDGTYAGVDISSYHLNMPAVFMWVKGFDRAPITIHFAIPDTNWTIATQLKPTAEPTTFTAPGLQYFMDAPTKIGM